MSKLPEQLPVYLGLSERCQRLADGAMDERAAMELNALARDYKALADELARQEAPQRSKK
jgi:hypothetical protein